MKYLPALFAAFTAVASLGASAQVDINVNLPGVIVVAPPAPRVEVMPAPMAGQVWIQGHWRWVNGSYAWTNGHWVPARPGYLYAPGRWEQTRGGWRWVDGRWNPGKSGKGQGHRHDNGTEHCPPGQAKKGRC